MTDLAPQPVCAQGIARVLVIDDSAVARGLMARWIDDDPELVLVGSAVDGEHGIAKAAELRPDLIVLDVEMPKMDGLAALPILLRTVPQCRVVMASTLTRHAGEVTLRALSMGAADYASKPQAGRIAGAEEFRRDLIGKLKALAPRPVSWPQIRHQVTPEAHSALAALAPQATRTIHTVAAAPLPRGATPRSTARPSIIAIGSSTGGPEALRSVISQCSGGVAVPIVIAQHMPALFTKILAEHLAKASSLPCKEVEHGERLRAGQIYIAPGNYHFTVRRDAAGFYAELDQSPPINFCRPAVDPLFQSVAEATGGNALGIILTGMGHDGRDGVRALREAGGTILVQDEASSIVWGMPGAVAEAGLADRILPLSQIGADIVRRAKGGM